MSKQVLSIEQMQHLNELGVDTSKASMCWVCLNSEPYLSFYNKDYPQDDDKVIPTFTLQEILDLLPKKIDEVDVLIINPCKNIWSVSYAEEDTGELYGGFIKEELIDAAYEMLCWCIGNEYLKFK